MLKNEEVCISLASWMDNSLEYKESDSSENWKMKSIESNVVNMMSLF